MEIFQERLRECRKKMKKTQKEVAAGADIEYRNYRRYECGEVDPTIGPLVRLADYFNVSLDYLTGRTDE